MTDIRVCPETAKPASIKTAKAPRPTSWSEWNCENADGEMYVIKAKLQRTDRNVYPTLAAQPRLALQPLPSRYRNRFRYRIVWF